MPRRISLAIALAAVTVLAGCGGGAEPGTLVPPPSATPGAGTAGSPTAPPVLSEPEAAGRYLDIVRPYNEQLERFEQAVNGGDDLATLTRMAGDTAEALATEIEQLRETRWPESVQTHVDALVTASEQALPHWQEATEAQSRDDLVAAVLAAAEFDGAEPAGQIREILNLDAYDEEDY